MSGPLLCAKFDPSNTYLASAVVALDTHQIKVQSTNVSQSSLNTSFNLDSHAKVSTLSWLNVHEQLLIALALTNGSTLIYSPLTNLIVSELTTPTNLSVTDFHFSNETSTAWSSDIGGNIYEWDLSNFSLIQHFQISDLIESNDTITKLNSTIYNDEPHLLVGSHSVYVVNVKSKEVVKSFPAHVQPIHTLSPIVSDPDLFFTAAKGDRFINLYSLTTNSTKAVFVASSSVSSISLGERDGETSVLMVINETGNVEVFNNPLQAPSADTSNLQSKKKRRQGVQSRSPSGSMVLSRPKIEIKGPEDASLTVNAISVTGDSFIYTWFESGNVPYCDSSRWVDESSGNALFQSSIVVEKSRPQSKTTVHAEKGHDIASASRYNESQAIIAEGNNLQEIEDSDEEGETLADKLEKMTSDQKSTKKTKKKWDSGKNYNTGTLTIVLAQSLKSNDHTLLETVLMNRDPVVVQETIAKLDPSLAVLLLDRLSERITRQASRFDQLNFWLKWIIVIHGGVLSSLPNLNTKLANLHGTLNKKASNLPRLLELEGRLNLLFQQVELKKEIIHNGTMRREFSDDEEEVEYIEEIDDSKFNGDISSDEDLEDLNGDLHDDFDDQDDDEEESILSDAMELDHNSDGYSDVEVDTK